MAKGAATKNLSEQTTK